MSETLNILLGQINPTVGAIEANREKIITIIKLHQHQYDLIVFPELALTGYPPEDLLFRKEFHQAVLKNLSIIQQAVQDCHVIVGHPTLNKEGCYNAASIFFEGQKIKEYRKQHLPNYHVFDEARYFLPGKQEACVIEVNNNKIGLIICEDLWLPGPMEQAIEQEVSVIIIINASPFDYTKLSKREALLKNYAQSYQLNMVYVNQVGGQDELLFDGQSMALDAQGTLCLRAPAFEEDLCSLSISEHQMQGNITPLLEKEALLYKALVCGTRDYLHKNHIPGALIGLSGGIDSALTLAIAVDALGAEQVHAVLMPSHFTSPMSNEDALEQINNLKVTHSILSIEPAYQTLVATLAPVFENKPTDTTEENIQARIRGLLLMALSNKTGKMVLTTSNKSETAVGYATLYGDMSGGFAVLKDILKTEVYALARYRNSLSKIIPQRVLDRAPTAELRANQTDQDSLPAYHILDAVLVAFMQEGLSPEEIIAKGYEASHVVQILHLLKRNEFKRKQSAPGIKVSPTAFGKDWRYPITNGFHSDCDTLSA